MQQPQRAGRLVLRVLLVGVLALVVLLSIVGVVAFRAIGGAAQSFLVGLGATVEAAYRVAADHAQASPEAQSLLGEPLVVAPIADVQWLPARGNDELQFEVPLRGAQASGRVHATVRLSQGPPRLASLRLTLDDCSVHTIATD